MVLLGATKTNVPGPALFTNPAALVETCEAAAVDFDVEISARLAGVLRSLIVPAER